MILIDIGEGRKTKETNWDLSYVCATRHIKVGLGFLAVKKRRGRLRQRQHCNSILTGAPSLPLPP